MKTNLRTDAQNDLKGFSAAEYFASHSRHAYRQPKNRRTLSVRQNQIFIEALRRVSNGERIEAVEAWVRKAVAA